MATISCPSCGLPRAEELFEHSACPVCGATKPIPLPTDEDEPDGDQPWVIPEAPVSLAVSTPATAEQTQPSLTRSRGPTVSGTLLGLLIGVPVGGAGVLGWQALPADVPPVEQVEMTTAKPQAASDDPHPVAPAPRVVVAYRPPTPLQPDPAEVHVQPVPIPPNPFRPAAPPAMRLDNPGGTSAPFVRPGGTLVLRGRVKKLVVSGLERGAVLDCSELETAEVIVTGAITGGSRLAVRAPGGVVRFLAVVEGRSDVDVTARSVEFQSRIAGAGTRVRATLTDGGSLVFAEIADLARLEYRKAAQGDPEPAVTPGRITVPAVVARVE